MKKSVVIPLFTILILMAGLLVSEPVAGKEESKSNWPKSLTLTSPPEGSSGYIWMVAISKVISQKLGITTSVQPTSSSLESTILLVKGEAHIASGSPAAYVDVYNNQPNLPLGSKYVRHLLGGYKTNYNWIVRAESDIRKIPDLRGKRVMCERPGQPYYQKAWPAVLQAYGMTRKDIKVMPALGQRDAADALKVGYCDAFFHSTKVGAPLFLDLDRAVPIRQLPIPPDKVKTVKKSVPWVFPAINPGGVYKGTPKDTPILGVSIPTAVRSTVPDDLVYAIIETIYDNLDEILETHKAFKDINKRDLPQHLVTPYHAGAYKFYKKKGMLTLELEETHKRFLAQGGQKK